MDINKKIDELRFQRGWSMYELAQEAGITQSTLTSMMKRGNPPKIDTLECICEAFGITLAQFFVQDEEIEILAKNEKRLISLFRKLSARQQQGLIELIDR
ncbi:MAG: helix-turn-helix transcriptional regulator [Clostridia bacterium]|nr:helix-turn-helix transcriptional regulator [Clostridia bacterium]